MFTIKHINAAGIEELYSSTKCRFHPKGLCNGTALNSESSGIIHLDGVTTLHGGTVFVMNETGKTVARYDLGASPVPIVGDGLSDPRPLGTGMPDAFPVQDVGICHQTIPPNQAS